MKKAYQVNNNLVVGLDIGTTKIVTVVGYRDENDQIEVIGWGKSKSSGVEFGQIFNLTKTTNSIQLSKETAANNAGVDINEVYVGVAGHHIRTSKYTHIKYRHDKAKEPITEEEIRNLKEEIEKVSTDPGEKIIDVIPQYYLLNKNRTVTDPVGELATEIVGTYQLITGKDAEIEKILMCGTSSNIHIKEIILEPLASAIACLTEEDKKGVALVDIGGGTSDLIIYVDGSPVFTKVISIGGNLVTEDIANICKITKDTAETIKLKYGTCVVDKSNPGLMITIPKPHGVATQISENHLAQIINARVEGDILSRIAREIENSGYKDKLYNGLVLTGGGSQLKHIKELCQYTLGLPTRMGVPDIGFSKGIPNELKSPMYSTVLGLLKYGIEVEESDMTDGDNGNGRKHSGRNNGEGTKLGFLNKITEYIRKQTETIS